MQTEPLWHMNLNRRGDISRRQALQFGAAGLAGSAFLGAIHAQAAELKKQNRACILMWLSGAPSQLEMFDPKPGTKNGGPTKAISTSVAGIKIAEHWPKLAKQMREIAVIRAMVGKEAAHDRGTYHLHTGRRLGAPEKFPTFGSVVAHQLGDDGSDLPNFVSIGQTQSSGFLGVKVAPFIVNRAGQLPADVSTATPRARMDRRLALLQEQESDFAAAGASALVDEHKVLYSKATRLMRTPRLKSFTLNGESEETKAAYGSNPTGQGLLVARRLIESGVPFVEVRKGGWDMHDSVFDRIKPAAGEVDQGVSALLIDLKERGMLDKTLVICMGEFGRTPKINSRTPKPGRDHWARNFNILLAGAGIRGGQAIGATSDDGQEVIRRPVTVEDFFQTLCKAMTIDADEEFWTPSGRPLKIVDGGQPVNELFS